MKITGDGKTPGFVAIDISKDELVGSIYSKRQFMFTSTQNNGFSKKQRAYVSYHLPILTLFRLSNI